MRNLTLCFLFVICAVVWAGCPGALQKTSDTLDRVTRATRETEESYKQLTAERLEAIAAQERDARTAALARGGCSTDAEQPSTAKPECHAIAASAKVKYEARKEKVVVAVHKIDAATRLVYIALLTAVDMLILVREGATGKWPKLKALVAEAVRVGESLLTAWSDYKKNVASY